MKTIKIRLDYLHGPIWKDKIDIVTGKYLTGIRAIDEDEILRNLDEDTCAFYSSFYHFDEGASFSFRMDKEQKEILIGMIKRIKRRLEEINDGSYVVEDEETSRLMEEVA